MSRFELIFTAVVLSLISMAVGWSLNDKVNKPDYTFKKEISIGKNERFTICIGKDTISRTFVGGGSVIKETRIFLKPNKK